MLTPQKIDSTIAKVRQASDGYDRSWLNRLADELKAELVELSAAQNEVSALQRALDARVEEVVDLRVRIKEAEHERDLAQRAASDRETVAPITPAHLRDEIVRIAPQVEKDIAPTLGQWAEIIDFISYQIAMQVRRVL